MKYGVRCLAVLAILLVSEPALSQLPVLPPAPSFPRYIPSPLEQNYPTVWASGDRDKCTDLSLERRVAYNQWFRDWLDPDGFAMFAMVTRDGSNGSMTEALTLPYKYHLSGYPDVYGDFVVADLVDCVLPNSCLYVDRKIRSFDLMSGVEYDLSGNPPGNFDMRPSIGDKFVAWQNGGCCSSSGVSFNVTNGDPSSRQEIYLGSGYSLSWPSVWSQYIVFEVAYSGVGGNEFGIGVYDVYSGYLGELTDPWPSPGYRFAPHVAEGRIVYHFRDDRSSTATSSEIRYMDIDSLGAEVTPSFVSGLSCDKMTGPRVGGEKGRYIVFTGVKCDGLPQFSLLLGDEDTGAVYFIDTLSREPDAGDHRVPYDIHGNVVVYHKDHDERYEEWGVAYSAIVVYEFDESQL